MTIQFRQDLAKLEEKAYQMVHDKVIEAHKVEQQSVEQGRTIEVLRQQINKLMDQINQKQTPPTSITPPHHNINPQPSFHSPPHFTLKPAHICIQRP